MSDTTQTDSTRTIGESTPDVNRRQVLQSIGAAGVASVVGTTQAQARTWAVSNDALQSDEEVDISTQFWTFFANTDLSVSELIRRSADAGYDAVEPFRLDDVDAISAALDETGLELSSAHVGLGELEENFEETIQTYSDLGATTLVHPWQGPDTWSSEDSILEFADRMSEMADRVADEGLEFGYHNHDQEFQTIGDTVGYDIFAQNVSDNLHLQIDAGWVLTGGYDPIEYIQRYGDQVGSIHMKNMTADGEFREIDEGDVNMRAVATAARNAADVDYLIYEYDATPTPIKSMKTGAEWLSRVNSRPELDSVCNSGADTHPALL